MKYIGLLYEFKSQLYIAEIVITIKISNQITSSINMYPSKHTHKSFNSAQNNTKECIKYLAAYPINTGNFNFELMIITTSSNIVSSHAAYRLRGIPEITK